MSDPARVTVPGFVRAIWRRRGRGMAYVVVLLVLSSLTEGAGLLLLVPMLALAGVPLGGGAMDGIARGIGTALMAAGLPVTLPVVLGVTVLVIALRSALVQAESVAATRFGLSIVSEERLRLFRAIAAMPWPRFVRLRGADLVQALTAYADDANFAARSVLGLVAEFLTVGVSLAIALRISWPVTLLVVVAGVALFATLRAVRAPGRAEGERLMAHGEVLFRATTDAIDGMKVVKGYAAERRTVEAYARANDAVVAGSERLDALRARAAVAVGVGGAALLSAMVYIALAVLHLAPAALLLLLAVYARLVPRVASAQLTWQHLNESLATWDALQALLVRCERDAVPLPSGAVHARRTVAPAVALDAVTYRYDGATRDAVHDASFHVPPGSMTAIVGRSGAGKSTVVDLVIGLLRPAHGAVTVDGAALTDATVDGWRGNIGLLPQDVALFPGTVRENLRWARPDASDAALRAALHAALATFVYALPSGLDTPVGDRGTLLSGGERQRLALARALLREPVLLVLDEATSALDAEHERSMLAALRALMPRVTIVVVTHRLGVVQQADHVVVLDDGAVIAEGRWADLRRSEARVRELFAL